MPKTIKITVSTLLLAIFSVLLPIGYADEAHHNHHDSATGHDFVVSGVLLNSGNARLVEQFVKLLGEQSGYPMKARFVSTYEELSEKLRKQPDAIGWTCGAPFVQDHRRDGQQLVSIPLFNGQPLYHSVILTRQGRPEKNLADFKGQILAYSDPRSNSGFYAPAYALKKQGIDMKKHFRLLLHTGNHERSIIALVNGLADVAAVDEYVWVAWLKNHPQQAQNLREIDRLGPFPFTPIVAGKEVPPATIQALQKTLTSLPDIAGGKQLLEEFGLDGFVIKTPDFYQPIENMLIELNGTLR